MSLKNEKFYLFQVIFIQGSFCSSVMHVLLFWLVALRPGTRIYSLFSGKHFFLASPKCSPDANFSLHYSHMVVVILYNQDVFRQPVITAVGHKWNEVIITFPQLVIICQSCPLTCILTLLLLIHDQQTSRRLRTQRVCRYWSFVNPVLNLHD